VDLTSGLKMVVVRMKKRAGVIRSPKTCFVSVMETWRKMNLKRNMVSIHGKRHLPVVSAPQSNHTTGEANRKGAKPMKKKSDLGIEPFGF
jgi:hypothetical protein